MKKLIKNILTTSSGLLVGLLFFGQNVFAAPVAPVVTPTTVTSGGSVEVTMHCTVAGNTITAINTVVSGTSTPISSFSPHTCTASDVTTGFTESVILTITGSTAVTTTINYVETGSTAGGSPGTSPASSSITVNPSGGSTAKAILNATGETVALDGSNPITNNMWLKHTYTIKNTGTTDFVLSSSDRLHLSGGFWFENNEAQIIDSGGASCVQSGFGYDCSNFTIPAGGSVVISFKTYFQICQTSIDTNTIRTEELYGPSSSKYGYDLSSTFSKHSFSYKYIGCDFTSTSTNPVGGGSNSSSVQVPKTGYSPLVTSLMIISAGAVLAGGSVIAFNKFKK